jgi:hypothetical protein
MDQSTTLKILLPGEEQRIRAGERGPRHEALDHVFLKSDYLRPPLLLPMAVEGAMLDPTDNLIGILAQPQIGKRLPWLGNLPEADVGRLE